MARKITLAYGYSANKELDLEEGFLVQLEGSGPRFMAMANITREQLVIVYKEMLKNMEAPLEWIVEHVENEIKQEYRKLDPKGHFIQQLGDEDLDFFLQDGMTHIGCLSNKSKDEFFFGKFGVLYVYTSDIKRFKKAFKALAVPQKSQLNTIWSAIKNEGVEILENSLRKDGNKILDLLLKHSFVTK